MRGINIDTIEGTLLNKSAKPNQNHRIRFDYERVAFDWTNNINE